MIEKRRRQFKLKYQTRIEVKQDDKKNAMDILFNFIGNNEKAIDPKFTSKERPRRMGMLFLNLMIGDEEHIKVMSLAAGVIQRKWRRIIAKRDRKILIQKQLLEATIKVQKWFRYTCWLQDRDDAVWIIQKAMKAKLKRNTIKNNAARRVINFIINYYYYNYFY